MSIETPAKPRSQKRQRPAVAATRLTSDELQDVRRAADSTGLSVSDYVRRVIVTASRATS